MVALSAALSACGESDEGAKAPTSSASTTTSTSATPDHSGQTAEGENEYLAQLLVPMPGYSYEDAPEDEAANAVEALQGAEENAGIAPGALFGAVSLHSIVAEDEAQNRTQSSIGPEVGLLVLVQFTEVPPPELESQIIRQSVGYEEADQLDIAGTTVYVFENPSSADSRWYYSWIEDQVQGTIDGATRPELERWLEAYLSALAASRD